MDVRKPPKLRDIKDTMHLGGKIIDNGALVFSHSLHVIVEIIIVPRPGNSNSRMSGCLPYPSNGV